MLNILPLISGAPIKVRLNSRSGFEARDLAQSGHPSLEDRDEGQVENGEVNEARDFAHDHWVWPVLDQLMFAHCWSVTVLTDIDAHELKLLGEDTGLLQAKGQVLSPVD